MKIKHKDGTESEYVQGEGITVNIPKKKKKRWRIAGYIFSGIIIIGTIGNLMDGDEQVEEEQNLQVSSEVKNGEIEKDENTQETREEKADKIENGKDLDNEENIPDEIEYAKYSADQLIDELDANALRANKNHKKEYVEVIGKISAIDEDGWYISLRPIESNSFLSSITCYVSFTKRDEQRKQIMKYEQGDKLTVRGKIVSVGDVFGYDLKMYEIL